MWPFLWNILEPVINLKTFDECLNFKKHVQIFKFLKKPYQQMFCVWQRTLITYWNDFKFIGFQFHEHTNKILNNEKMIHQI